MTILEHILSNRNPRNNKNLQRKEESVKTKLACRIRNEYRHSSLIEMLDNLVLKKEEKLHHIVKTNLYSSL